MWRGYLRLDGGADRGLELMRVSRSDEYWQALTQADLHAHVAAGRVRPSRGPEAHAPAAVVDERTVVLHLETDDVPKRYAPRRPEVAERDAHTAVGDVDVEVRQRDERGDEHDHDRCGREEQRVVRPRKDNREDGDPTMKINASTSSPMRASWKCRSS